MQFGTYGILHLDSKLQLLQGLSGALFDLEPRYRVKTNGFPLKLAISWLSIARFSLVPMMLSDNTVTVGSPLL